MSQNELAQVEDALKESEFSYYAYVSGLAGQGPGFFLMRAQDRF